MTNNNLGGHDTSKPSNLRFDDLASGVDLVITNLTKYIDSATSAQTGKTSNGRFGQINQRLGRTTDYLFSFLDHDTQQPKNISEFYFSFYDIDQFIEGKNWEMLTIDGFDSWSGSTRRYVIQINTGGLGLRQSHVTDESWRNKLL